MAEPNYITPIGLERLQREINWLQKADRPRIVREVAYAASLGDRSENAEYIYGKKRLREIDSRLHFLIKRLDNIVVIDPGAGKGDVVRFGATVTIADDDGKERTWRIYGEDEVSVEHGILSHRAPLARALMGKREGDSVKFEAPGGLREVEIITVIWEAQEPLPDALFALKDA